MGPGEAAFVMGLGLAAAVLGGVGAAAIPRWNAPASCPDQAEVDRWVGRLTLETSAEVPDWHAVVERSAEGAFVLTLNVEGRTRTLSDGDCGRLAIAAALVVGVASDPLAVTDAVDAIDVGDQVPEPPLPVAAKGSRPARASVATRLESPPASSTPKRSPRASGIVSAALGGELGVLPRPGFAATLGGGLVWSQLRLELVGVVSVPRDVVAREEQASAAGFGARAAVASGQVRGCWVVPAAPLEIPLCVGGEAGALWARGFGPNIAPQARAQLWAAAVPSVGLSGWFSSRWGLEARLSVPVALYQPAVHLAGVDVSVFRVGPVGARMWIGPVVRFP